MDDQQLVADSPDLARFSEKSLAGPLDIPVIPLLERSCSDCGVGAGAGGGTCRRRQAAGKFRRVLSETW